MGQKFIDGAKKDWSQMIDSSPAPKEATLAFAVVVVAAAELALAWWASVLLGQMRIPL